MTVRTENQMAGVPGPMGTEAPVAWRWLALYVALAFAITWAILIPTLALVPEEAQILFIIVAAFGPFVAAIITVRVSQGRRELGRWLKRILRLRIPVILHLAGAFLLPALFGAMHFGLYRALGGRPDFASAEPWYFYLAYLIPTALLTGGNEEPGWRGYALPALLTRVSPLAASLILGVIHSLWHLPLMGSYDTDIGWYMFNVIPLTVFLNWFYLRSRGSVIPVALLHASTNVMSAFLPTPDTVLGRLGTELVLRGLVYWAIAIVIAVATKGRLGWKPEAIVPRPEQRATTRVAPTP